MLHQPILGMGNGHSVQISSLASSPVPLALPSRYGLWANNGQSGAVHVRIKSFHPGSGRALAVPPMQWKQNALITIAKLFGFFAALVIRLWLGWGRTISPLSTFARYSSNPLIFSFIFNHLWLVYTALIPSRRLMAIASVTTGASVESPVVSS